MIALDSLPRPVSLPLPPADLHEVGDGDFEGIGWEFIGHLVQWAGLRDDARLLDIGCGTGRLARPLSACLGPAGRYVGFDVSHRAIAWCQQEIAARDPRFSFQHADIQHPLYNPAGAVKMADFRVPAADGTIDIAVAMSIFTHLPPLAVMRYLAEVRRCLASGGRFLCTAFLLDGDSRALIAAGKAHLPFAADVLNHWQEAYPEHPGAAVALDRAWFEQAAIGSGLRLLPAPAPGTWCGRDNGGSFQDVLILAPA